jgi:hypothetical protein
LVRAAVGLARKYSENGAAVAKQIEYGFYGEADRIPADIIADYVVRLPFSDGLFKLAREIEMASTSVELRSYDEMSPEAKSLLGVFLDFNGVSREKVAAAWPRRIVPQNKETVVNAREGVGPLFEKPEQSNDRKEEVLGEPPHKS